MEISETSISHPIHSQDLSTLPVFGFSGTQVSTRPTKLPSKQPKSGSFIPERLSIEKEFVRVPNKCLEHQYKDKNASVSSRIIAWLRRHSWGYNFRDAVIPLRGLSSEDWRFRPARQFDIARELDLLPAQVSRGLAELRSRGYIAEGQGQKTIRLSLDPKPTNIDCQKRGYRGGQDAETRRRGLVRRRFTQHRQFRDSPEVIEHLIENPQELEEEIESLIELRLKIKQLTQNAEPTAPSPGSSALEDKSRLEETSARPASLDPDTAIPQAGTAIPEPRKERGSLGQPTSSSAITNFDNSFASEEEAREGRIRSVQRGATALFSRRLKPCDSAMAKKIEQALGGRDPDQFFKEIREESSKWTSYGLLPEIAKQYASTPVQSDVDPSTQISGPQTKREQREEFIRKANAEATASFGRGDRPRTR